MLENQIRADNLVYSLVEGIEECDHKIGERVI